MATALPSLDISRHYTIEEFEALELPEDGPVYELLNGKLLVSNDMSIRHQRVVLRIARRLEAYLGEFGPLEVAAFGDFISGRELWLKPDVLVFPRPRGRDPASRDVTAWWLVVEVLSPSNRKRDLTVKRRAYVRCGVPEVWLIDQMADTAMVVRRGEEDLKLFRTDTLVWRAPEAPSAVNIELAEIFAD